MPMKFGRRAYNRKYKQRQRVRAKANGLCPSCCCRPAPRPASECMPGERPIITCEACVRYGASRTSSRRAKVRKRRGEIIVPKATTTALPNECEGKSTTRGRDAAETEKLQILLARTCQQQFKNALKKYWNSACCVTGSTFVPLLRASHIKPWAWSSHAERRDVHNGLLLLPHLDALFDAGLISFRDDGVILISSKLPEIDRDRLNLSRRFKLLRVVPAHLPYLHYHRTMVYEKPRRRRTMLELLALTQDDVGDVAA